MVATAYLFGLHGDFVSLDWTSALILLQPSCQLAEAVHATVGVLEASDGPMLVFKHPQRLLARDKHAGMPAH